jgi:hypothetical protein
VLQVGGDAMRSILAQSALNAQNHARTGRHIHEEFCPCKKAPCPRDCKQLQYWSATVSLQFSGCLCEQKLLDSESIKLKYNKAVSLGQMVVFIIHRLFVRDHTPTVLSTRA